MKDKWLFLGSDETIKHVGTTSKASVIGLAVFMFVLVIASIILITTTR